MHGTKEKIDENNGVELPEDKRKMLGNSGMPCMLPSMASMASMDSFKKSMDSTDAYSLLVPFKSSDTLDAKVICDDIVRVYKERGLLKYKMEYSNYCVRRNKFCDFWNTWDGGYRVYERNEDGENE